MREYVRSGVRQLMDDFSSCRSRCYQLNFSVRLYVEFEFEMGPWGMDIDTYHSLRKIKKYTYLLIITAS